MKSRYLFVALALAGCQGKTPEDKAVERAQSYTASLYEGTGYKSVSSTAKQGKGGVAVRHTFLHKSKGTEALQTDSLELFIHPDGDVYHIMGADTGKFVNTHPQ